MTSLHRCTMPLILACTFAIAAIKPVQASEATKRAKVQQMFQLLQIEKTIDQVSAQQVGQAKSLIANLVGQQATSSEQQKDINAFLDRILAIAHEAVNWQKLEPQYLDLYTQAYSEEEIDGILAFYRSPVGQEMLAKQPELLAKSQAITQAQVIAVLPQIRAAAIQFAQQMNTKYTKGSQ